MTISANYSRYPSLIHFHLRKIHKTILAQTEVFLYTMLMKDISNTVLFFRSPQRREWPANEKLKGIFRFARARQWKVITLDAPKTEIEARTTIAGWKPMGCLVDMNASRRIFTQEVLAGVPAVFLDFDNRLLGGRTFRVNHDPVAVGSLAAQHLMAMGCTNFAFVGYTRQWSWSQARLIAFKKALSHAGRKTRAFEMPAGRPPTTKERAAFDNFLTKLPRPCGLMLANDTLAEELYPACSRIGVLIPNDFAVIGVDDDERLCNNLKPTLSSIRLDFNHAGWLLAELLHLRLSNQVQNPTVHHYEPLGIAPRESTSLPLTPKTPHSIVMRIEREIAKHALDGCTVAQILSPLGCSRRSAETHYRTAKNKSILTAIREMRLCHAKKLLKETTLSVADIADACGYKRTAHFAEFFRMRTGQTLSAWRKKHTSK